MVSAAERALEAAPRSGLLLSLRRLYLRSEGIRAYLLLSPMLLVMVTMMVVPMVGLVILSFWTQVYFEIDHTFTIKNYADISGSRTSRSTSGPTPSARSPIRSI